MKSQEDTILSYLQDNPSGAHPTSIVSDTKILQYNARINGLRARFKCSHKNNNTICFATEHIINKKVHNGTIFVYKKTAAPWDYKKEEKRIEQVSQVQEGLF